MFKERCLIDIKTVFVCIMHTTFFYSVAYSAFWLIHKTYKGFGCWTLATICNLCLYGGVLLRLISNEWLGFVSVVSVSLFIPLSVTLRTDAILRFTENRKLPWYVYLPVLAVIPLNLYFFHFFPNTAIRFAILILVLIPFNYIICKSLFSFVPSTGRLLSICGGIFFLMRLVGLSFESILLFMHKKSSSIFESPDMGSYLLFTLISEVGFGLFFFMMSAQRSQEELLDANTLLEDAKKNSMANLESDQLFAK